VWTVKTSFAEEPVKQHCPSHRSGEKQLLCEVVTGPFSAVPFPVTIGICKVDVLSTKQKRRETPWQLRGETQKASRRARSSDLLAAEAHETQMPRVKRKAGGHQNTRNASKRRACVSVTPSAGNRQSNSRRLALGWGAVWDVK
jgi:hypothetical protein